MINMAKFTARVNEYSSYRKRSAKVEVADLRIVQYFLVCSLQPHLTAFHNHALGRNTETGANILLNEQDGPAPGVHQLDGLVALLESLWIKAHRGFVQ